MIIITTGANCDVSWTVFLAQQINSGQTLYVDFTDINPPFIFMLFSLPAHSIDFFNFSVEQTTFLLYAPLSITSLYLSHLVLCKSEYFSQNYSRNSYMITLAFIILIAPAYSMGQREHIFVITTIPYILRHMYLNSTESTDTTLLVSVALLASIGLNIKPYFFLLPLFLETFAYFKHKKLSLYLGLSNMIMLFSALAYLLIIYVFFNTYLTHTIPNEIGTYSEYMSVGYVFLLEQYELIVYYFLVITYFVKFKKRTKELTIMIITMTSFAAIYFMQGKGWHYHSLPLYLLEILFLYTTLSLKEFYKKSDYQFTSIIGIALLSITYMQNARNLGERSYISMMSEIVKKDPSIKNITVYSHDIAIGSRTATQCNTQWCSRYPSIWMLPYMIAASDDVQIQRVVDEVYEDIVRYKTDILFFHQEENAFDYFLLFETYSDEFSQLMENSYIRIYTNPKRAIVGYKRKEIIASTKHSQ